MFDINVVCIFCLGRVKESEVLFCLFRLSVSVLVNLVLPFHSIPEVPSFWTTFLGSSQEGTIVPGLELVPLETNHIVYAYAHYVGWSIIGIWSSVMLSDEVWESLLRKRSAGGWWLLAGSDRERAGGPRVGGCQPAQPTSHTADTLTTDNTTTTFITQDPGNNERQEWLWYKSMLLQGLNT